MDDEARDGPDHVPLENRSDGEPPDRTPERPGAADGLRRHRERSPSPPAWRYFEVLVAEEQDWFDRMVTYVAAVHRVDRDDLYQEVALGLRTADPLSLGREGWRTWLRQRTWWKDQDIRRSRWGGRTASHDREQLARLAAERQRAGPAGEPTAHQREWIGPDDTLRRLRRLGLSHDQALLLQLTMFDPDLTLKDIADRLGDSYAAVRQRQVRAMRAARAGFGLQPDEEAALRAVWTHSSGADAAPRARHRRVRAAPPVRAGHHEDPPTARRRRMRTMWPDGVDDDLGSPGGSIRHAFLASAWRRDPVVRLTYEPGDDVLVAEIGPGEGPETVEVHPDLVVQFVGAGGWPVLVSLAGARGAVGTALGSVVDEVIGPRAWAVAQRLVAVGGPAAEVTAAEVDLDGDDVAALEATWVGLAERLRATAVPPARVEPRPDDRVVGVEVLPREVRAGMVDLRGRVSGVRTVALDSGSPAEVQGAVEKLLGDIGGDAVVGLQIGGPVDSEAGVVRHYGKQVDGGEWPKRVPLGHDLETSTRRTVTVVNDAQALAHWEVEFGLGATESTFAVLLVGQGVGARYVHDGQVRPYGMEIGMFVPNLGLRSVEEEAGTSAMMRTIREELGIEVASFAEAAELVDEHEDEAIPRAVLELFRKAGRDIATGMGAAQAILDPRFWALHVPPPLDELDSALGEAFRDGLSTIDDRVRYTDLHKPVLVVRAVDGDTGIAAAATVARHLTGHRSIGPAARC